MSTRDRILCFFISFVIVAFGQNAWIGFLGPLAAVIGFALFWRGIVDCKPRSQRFWLSLGWFALVQAVQLSWMTTTEYMGPMILLIYGFLLLSLGVQFGLLSLLIPTSGHITVPRALGLAGLWVFLEYSRLYLCTGFTWNPVGIALATSPIPLQAASLFGIYGLSFWVVFVNLLVLRAIFSPSRISVLTAGCLAVLPFVFGATRLFFASYGNQSLSVLLVQTNLLPEQRDYDPVHAEKYLAPVDQWNRILDFLDAQKDRHVDMIVFPEGAVPIDSLRKAYALADIRQIWKGHYGENADIDFPLLGEPLDWPMSRQVSNDDWNVSNSFIVQALANHYQCEVIVGMNAYDRKVDKRFNAAFRFAPEQEIPGRVEKRVLVPVGEYVPFKQWKFFTDFIARHFGISDSFDPGETAKIFTGRIPMGVSICYEETYSQMIHELRALGAEMLVNISNDVWFPRSRLARQHFDHGMVRSVENGVPLVRACNTGITGGVDCWGRTIALHAETEPGALYFQLPLTHKWTLYSFWGDAAILMISAFWTAVLFARFFFKKEFFASCSK